METETQRTNTIIAEFMAIESFKCDGELLYKFKKHPCQYIDNPLTASIEDLFYHSRWDWIMPVIDKIEDIRQIGTQGYVDISPFNIETYCSGSVQSNRNEFSYQLNGRHFSGKEKLNAVYKCVVEFIEYYNR
jgi:hypothetical protein